MATKGTIHRQRVIRLGVMELSARRYHRDAGAAKSDRRVRRWFPASSGAMLAGPGQGQANNVYEVPRLR
jgi:hypothetical protein